MTCEVVIGSFVFGPALCGNPGVGKAKVCEYWPECQVEHVVCAEHSAPNESLDPVSHAQPSLSVTAPNDASTASPIATDTPSPTFDRTEE